VQRSPKAVRKSLEGNEECRIDKDRPAEENPVQDHNNWYKFGVPPDKVEELRKHVERATQEFGQKSIYFERAGEADFIRNPTLRPPRAPTRG